MITEEFESSVGDMVTLYYNGAIIIDREIADGFVNTRLTMDDVKRLMATWDSWGLEPRDCGGTE